LGSFRHDFLLFELTIRMVSISVAHYRADNRVARCRRAISLSAGTMLLRAIAAVASPPSF